MVVKQLEERKPADSTGTVCYGWGIWVTHHRGTREAPLWLSQLARQHSAMAQKPLTNAVAVSIGPAIADALSGCTREAPTATCRWSLLFPMH